MAGGPCSSVYTTLSSYPFTLQAINFPFYWGCSCKTEPPALPPLGEHVWSQLNLGAGTLGWLSWGLRRLPTMCKVLG